MNRMKKVGVLSLCLAFLLLEAPITLAQPDLESIEPEPRSRSEVAAALAKAPKPPEGELRDIHIVMVADEVDHGPHEHGYPVWQKNWALLLGGGESGHEATQINLYGDPVSMTKEDMSGTPHVTVDKAWQWPSKEQWEKADLVAVFCYARWNEERVAQIKAFLERGGGFISIHPACIMEDDPVVNVDEDAVDLIGLIWKQGMTTWRHGPMNLDIAKPDHPICLGLPKQLYFMDEAYWPLYGDRSKVTIIATSKETEGEVDTDAIQFEWPKEPTKDEPMFWTYEHGKGRVYGCILGHYDWTFDDPYFRMLLLRGMAWAAHESPYRFDPLVLRGIELKD